MDIPLSMVGGPQAPDRLDDHPQFIGADTRSQNLAISMLPPETTATIGPAPALPGSAAASDNDPAPSAMTRAFSASMRIASLVCSRLTTIAPSTTGFSRSHMRGKRLWPPAPSTNEAFQSLNTCGDPIENDKAVGAAVSGSTPHTLIAGFNAFKALPTPVMSPPPPMAAITATVSGASSRISNPMVLWPAMKFWSWRGG